VRLREFLIGMSLMFFALITTQAKASAVPPAFIDRPEIEEDLRRDSEPAVSAPLPAPVLVTKDKVLASAYYNTLAILSTNNRCSDFFGGPAISTEVFNRLVGQVRKDYDSASIAMRMSGSTTDVRNAQTNAHYRLFERVSINANGPFYRRAITRADRTVSGIGSFQPNTQEVRVLILLHELGHVMKGTDGKWLLPDDGKNEELSRNNSRKIEEVCGDQIKGLGNGEALRNLARRNQANEELALDSSNPEQSPIERIRKQN
jgi:hypothetical protein